MVLVLFTLVNFYNLKEGGFKTELGEDVDPRNVSAPWIDLLEVVYLGYIHVFIHNTYYFKEKHQLMTYFLCLRWWRLNILHRMGYLEDSSQGLWVVETPKKMHRRPLLWLSQTPWMIQVILIPQWSINNMNITKPTKTCTHSRLLALDWVSEHERGYLVQG